MAKRLFLLTVAATALLTSGCFALTEFDNIQTTERKTFTLPFEQEGKVPQFDILFVVDRPTDLDGNIVTIVGGITADTAYMEDTLGLWRIVGNGDPGAARDVVLHIGVITSDMGAGSEDYPGCDILGDDGILQVEPSAGCPTLSTDFLEVINGEVTTKEASDMDVGAAVQCLIAAQLNRVTSCPIKQPLKAVQRAVQHYKETSDSTFLQEEGGLAVVFISGEDDCSAEDPTSYDQSLHSPFHCLTLGLDCEQDGEHYRNCVEPPDSALLQTSALADVLRHAKNDENAVVISVMAGPYNAAVGVEVQSSQSGMEILPSCTGALDALPAVRLTMLKDHFADTSVFQEICTPDSPNFFDSVAHKLAAQAAYRCMPHRPVDQEPQTLGMQASCTILDVENPDVVGEELRHDPHPECGESGYGVTCWEMMPEATCTMLYKLVLHRAPDDEMENKVYEVEATCDVHLE